MKATKQFIEDAIEGGWNPRPEKATPKIIMLDKDEQDEVFIIFNTEFREKGNANGRTWTMRVEQILLDPLAWQAVGKTRGWVETRGDSYGVPVKKQHWRRQWIFFIDNLADGLSIEEALEAISK